MSHGCPSCSIMMILSRPEAALFLFSSTLVKVLSLLEALRVLGVVWESGEKRVSEICESRVRSLILFDSRSCKLLSFLIFTAVCSPHLYDSLFFPRPIGTAAAFSKIDSQKRGLTCCDVSVAQLEEEDRQEAIVGKEKNMWRRHKSITEEQEATLGNVCSDRKLPPAYLRRG